MSMPPPPPISGPPGGYAPPPGYQPYGAGSPVPSGKSGMAVAGMVLSLVGLVPCFWAFQVPGLLGVIFGFVGLGQTKDGRRRGRGMALTGVVLGIVLLVACAAFWIWLSTSANCYRSGGTWRCYSKP